MYGVVRALLDMLINRPVSLVLFHLLCALFLLNNLAVQVRRRHVPNDVATHVRAEAVAQVVYPVHSLMRYSFYYFDLGFAIIIVGAWDRYVICFVLGKLERFV